MSDNKILNKIKKLLALAKSSNANEAAAALSRAQKLMQEHAITLTDVDLADCSTAECVLDAKGVNKYEANLMHLISHAFGVEPVVSYVQINWKVKAKVCFLGISPQPELAQYCFDVLYRQLKQSRAQYIRQQSKRCKPSTKTKRGDAFAEAWCLAVYQTIHKFALSDEQTALIKTYKENKFKDIEDGKPRDRTKGKSRSKDYLAGVNAAENVRLDRPVNGKETAKLGCSS
ncbi:DUF2786 domain-containing protein [Colwellia psychrerythraea]|uniref:Uncharacterized protein n=1 Tax=Colwellia psychrerythraea TaxID=28229 RepID=A0A099KR85_COLPS|nr:DUF2786 domain-containing protein [Colwellia psychrerythraea]KGJ92133.1 protein of unknown function DUF2786 [Colwellia psychrerythraea]